MCSFWHFSSLNLPNTNQILLEGFEMRVCLAPEINNTQTAQYIWLHFPRWLLSRITQSSQFRFFPALICFQWVFQPPLPVLLGCVSVMLLHTSRVEVWMFQSQPHVLPTSCKFLSPVERHAVQLNVASKFPEMVGDPIHTHYMQPSPSHCDPAQQTEDGLPVGSMKEV